MTKKITITISDHIYEMYVDTIIGNKSRKIEGWILLANSVEETGVKNLKLDHQKVLALQERQKEVIKEQENKIANLERDLARYKDLYKNPETKARQKYHTKQVEREVFNEEDAKHAFATAFELSEKEREHFVRQYQNQKKHDGTYLPSHESVDHFNNRFNKNLTKDQYEKLEQIAFSIIKKIDRNGNFEDFPTEYVIKYKLGKSMDQLTIPNGQKEIEQEVQNESSD